MDDSRLIITVKIRARDNGQQFGRGMNKRLNALTSATKAAAEAGAQAATKGSRQKFRRMRRNDVPPRPGRRQRGMAAGLKWAAKKDVVVFDMADANRRFPYWLVQEIGTDGRATLFRGSTPNPKGRPKKGAEYVKFVPSQVGRKLRVALVFGTSAGGKYVAPGAGRGQNLYLAKDLTGVPFTGRGQRGSTRPRASIILGKEIKGQSMVQTGAKTGMAKFGPAAQNAGYYNFGGYPYVQH